MCKSRYQIGDLLQRLDGELWMVEDVLDISKRYIFRNTETNQLWTDFIHRVDSDDSGYDWEKIS